MAIIQRVSPLGRYAFGSIIDTTTNMNEKPEWLLWLELSMKDSEELLKLVTEQIKLGYDEFGKQWPAEQDKLNKPYRQASMPDPAGGSDRVPNPDAMIWIFKRKGTYFDKKTRRDVPKPPPQVIDSEGIPVKVDDRPPVGYGTTLKALFHVDHYYFKGQSGVAFRLNGFQIGKLRQSGTDVAGNLAPISGGWKQHESDVDLSALVGAAD